MVLTLLSQVPTLKCLVTSRHRLALPGEMLVAVSPLPIPEQDMELKQLGAVASVQLFMERAKTVAPEFQLKPENAETIAALCQRLEGIPLVIELVAARVSGVALTQILQALAQPQQLLRTEDEHKEDRYRSLWNAIAWSYQLLPPEIQRFFARLSVFQGSWDLVAAEQVCEQPNALEGLTQLRSHSLVLAKADFPELRFGLLKVLQEFAAAQLTAAEAQTLQQRHAVYYLDQVKAAHPDLSGTEQAVWLARLAQENENLRGVLSWSVTAQEHSKLGLELAGLLCTFWEVRGYLSEGRRWLAATLAVAKMQPSLERARALSGLGSLARGQGDYEQATACYQDSQQIYEQLQDQAGQAGCFNGLGNVAYQVADYPQAQAYYEQALEQFRQLQDHWWMAACLNNLGNILLDQGQGSQAKALFEEALHYMREQGDRRNVAYILHNLGDIAREEGQYQLAHQHMQEALTLNDDLEDQWGRAYTLNNLGHLAEDQGDYQRAADCYTDSRALCETLGDPWGAVPSIYGLGKVAQA